MIMPGVSPLLFMLWAVARQAAWQCHDYQDADEGEELDPVCRSLQRCKTLTHLALLRKAVCVGVNYTYEVCPDKLHGALAESASILLHWKSLPHVRVLSLK